MMNNIFITGVAGFIGSHIAEKLLKDNYQVCGIDNLTGNYPSSYYQENLNLLKRYKLFRFHKIDILDKKKINQLIKNTNYDFLIHCAAKTNVRLSIKSPDDYLKTNVLGTQKLLEAIRLINPKTKIILFSSSSVYGKQSTVPFKETMIPSPISPYGLSKYLMEQLAKFYADIYKLSIVVLRPFSIYGPRGRHDMLPNILLNCSSKNSIFNKFGNDNDNQRDWTHINDLISILEAILNSYNFNLFEVFNVGHSRPVGIDNFIQLFIKLTHRNIKIIKRRRLSIEAPVVYADITKIKKFFDFSPKITLKEGLKSVINHR